MLDRPQQKPGRKVWSVRLAVATAHGMPEDISQGQGRELQEGGTDCISLP